MTLPAAAAPTLAPLRAHASAPRVLLPPDGALPEPPGLGAVLHSLGGDTMGTTWSVRVAGPSTMVLAPLQRGIEQVLARVIRQMSTWEPDSDLCQFSRLAAGAWMDLPADFASVMACALAVAERSAGAYDPSAAPLVNAWGFGPSGGWNAPDFLPPSAAHLAALTLGWQTLQMDHDTGRLRQPGGLALDLSAVAKGHAVDALADLLRGVGLSCFLVEIGGELRGSGLKPDGQPWWVALEAPAPDCTLRASRVALCEHAVATSGDYRRHHQHGGRHYPHTIDPRTRQPVGHGLASVTVLHPSGMWADAWSTAVMVLGPMAGLALAEQEGLAALLQWREPGGAWAEASSSALQRWLA